MDAVDRQDILAQSLYCIGILQYVLRKIYADATNHYNDQKGHRICNRYGFAKLFEHFIL